MRSGLFYCVKFPACLVWNGRGMSILDFGLGVFADDFGNMLMKMKLS